MFCLVQPIKGVKINYVQEQTRTNFSNLLWQIAISTSILVIFFMEDDKSFNTQLLKKYNTEA